MTIEEVLSAIMKEHKWYIGKMAQQTASKTSRQIKLGKAKPETIRKFFEAFGYYGSFNEWSNQYEISENWDVSTNGIKTLHKVKVYKSGIVVLIIKESEAK